MVVGWIFLCWIQRSQLRENYRVFFCKKIPAHLGTIRTSSIITFEQVVEIIVHFFVRLKWVLQRVAQGINVISKILKAFGSTRLKSWVEALVHHTRLHNLFAKFFLKKFDLFFFLDAWSSYLLTFQDAAWQVHFFLWIKIWRLNKRKRTRNICRHVLNNLLLVFG